MGPNRLRVDWRRFASASLALEPLEGRMLLTTLGGLTTLDVQAAAAAALSVGAGPDAAAIVGEPFDLMATFTDEVTGQTHTATIDWGDGSPVEAGVVIEPVAPPPGPLTVRIDYSRDTNDFFDTQVKRDLLQHAADTITARFGDQLDAIVPGGGRIWTASFPHPATGFTETIDDMVVGANEILVFSGGRVLTGPLGIGGFGGTFASGFGNWLTSVNTRGQSGAGKTPATDFARWGGSITFDIAAQTDWYFDMDADGLQNDQADFLSVAFHEMAHLLGFGTADSWDAQIIGGEFAGPAAVAAFDGEGNVPLESALGHWAENTKDQGQQTAMDPTILLGTRKLMTELDFAALDDVGWELLDQTPAPGSVSGSHVYTQEGDYTVTVTVADDQGGVQFDTVTVTANILMESAIGNLIWEDLNGDGVADKGEPGIGSVTVGLYLDENQDGPLDAGDALLSLATTDADGEYEFTNLAAGNYLVQVTDALQVLAGFDLTSASNPIAIALGPRETFVGADFGYNNPAELKFGSFDGLKNVKLEFQGVTYSLKGEGFGMVLKDDLGNIDLEFVGTGPKSKVKVTAPKGQTAQLRHVDIIGGGLGSFDARAFDITGDFTSEQSTGKVVVRDIDANHLFTIGPGDEKATFSLQANDVFDLTLTSAIPLKKIDVTTWIDSDEDPDLITAPWAKAIQSDVNFEASVTLTDGGVKKTLGKLSVGGVISGAVIRAAGSIGGVTAGGLVDSLIFAGVAETVTGLPAVPADFTNLAATLGKVTLRGGTGLTVDFDNSLIAAYNIKKATLNRLATVNDGIAFGLASDNIKSVSYKVGETVFKSAKLTDPALSISEDDFNLKII